MGNVETVAHSRRYSSYKDRTARATPQSFLSGMIISKTTCDGRPSRYVILSAMALRILNTLVIILMS